MKYPEKRDEPPVPASEAETRSPDTGKHREGSGLLAWMGWRVRIQADWVPLDISGSWEKGSVVIGKAETELLGINWQRRGNRRFDAARWIDKRARKETGVGIVPGEGPQPEGFAHSAWIPEGRSARASGALWYGYAAHAHTVMTINVSGKMPDSHRRTIERTVIPSLRVSAPNDPANVVLPGACFRGASSYRTHSWHVEPGDVALHLKSSDHSGSLMLRQIYPAKKALSKSTLTEWLDRNPFPEQRQFHIEGKVEESALDLMGEKHRAVCKRGLRRFPLPLGAKRPFRCVGLAVHRQGIDRLLIAEHTKRDSVQKAVVVDAVQGMCPEKRKSTKMA